MSAKEQSGSTLTREQILAALNALSVPEYLLAMKCMAARIGGMSDEPSDVADITFLIRHLNLKSAKNVLDLIGQYYPANRIPVKTQYLVEGLFEEGKI